MVDAQSIVMSLADGASFELDGEELIGLSPRMSVFLGLRPEEGAGARVQEFFGCLPEVLAGSESLVCGVHPRGGQSFQASIERDAWGRHHLRYIPPPRIALDLARAQRAILEDIAAGRPVTEVLERIASLAETWAPGGMRSSILRYDREAGELRTAAQPSLPPEFVAGIDRLQPAPELASCGAAAATRLQVLTTCIATDPWWVEFASFMEEHGVRASWSSPVLGVEGELLATFGMYYPEERFPTAGELDLIDEFTHLVALVLQREEADRMRARNRDLVEQARTRESHFAAIAHDLRAPLQAIQLGVEHLGEQAHGVSEQEREVLESLEEATGYLMRVAGDATEVARPLETLTVRPTPIVPGELLENAVTVLQEQASKRGVEVLLESAEPGLMVLADPARIARVLVNLLGNAIRHTPRGGRIRLGAHRAEGSAEHITFHVSDSGPGVPLDQRDLVFEPFLQLRGARVGRPGVGLGLAIVRRFIEAHDGEVGVDESCLGGARFHFTLGAAQVGEPGSRASRSEGEEGPLEGVTVLVVDDSRVVRDALDRTLRRAGARTLTASDGVEAVASFERHRPAVVLIDGEMPNLSGPEAVQCIRGLEGGKESHLISLSGHHEERTEGVDLQLHKPISGKALVEELRQVLGR